MIQFKLIFTLLSFITLLVLAGACGPADSHRGFNSLWGSRAAPSLLGGGRISTVLGRNLERAEQALLTHPRIRGLLDSGDYALRPIQYNDGAGQGTFRYQISYQGVDVVGAQALAHVDAQAVEVEDSLPEFHVNATPSLSANEALSIARSHAPDARLSEPELLIFIPLDSEILAYRIAAEDGGVMKDRDLWINAHTGALVASIPHALHIAENLVFRATEESQTFGDQGEVLSMDLEKIVPVLKNGTAIAGSSLPADEASLQASANVEATLNYYERTFKRDSYDAKGATIKSIVHFGKDFSNAFWHMTGKFMAYGDGDGKETRNFTAAIDVAGHEMTHGVISESAKLMPIGESGAVNEALADFFGKMIEGENDWTVGTKLYLDPEARLGIRDLKEPGRIKLPYINSDQISATQPRFSEVSFPDHYDRKVAAILPCQAINDVCGVHRNATIFGHGAYRVHEAVGKEKTEQMIYLAMTQYMTPMSGLRSAARAVGKACDQLYDAGTCGKVREAFESVGL